jgi:hypothetical protein
MHTYLIVPTWSAVLVIFALCGLVLTTAYVGTAAALRRVKRRASGRHAVRRVRSATEWNWPNDRLGK